jgi:Fe2+ transport system protein FeoA
MQNTTSATYQNEYWQESPMAVPLSSIMPGNRVRMLKINAGKNLKGRFLAMGLIPGTEIRVISNAGKGPLLIAVRESRMTLGCGMAEKILVA